MKFDKILKNGLACLIFIFLAISQNVSSQVVGTPYLPYDASFSLDCSSVAFLSPVFSKTATYAGVISIPYSNGDESSYDTETISSTGITGLQAVLRPGTLAANGGDLVYDIIGTPSGIGNAVFAFNMKDVACIVTSGVYPPPVYWTQENTIVDNKKFIYVKNESPYDYVGPIRILHVVALNPLRSGPFLIEGVQNTTTIIGGQFYARYLLNNTTILGGQITQLEIAIHPSNPSATWEHIPGYGCATLPLNVALSSSTTAENMDMGPEGNMMTICRPNL